MTHHFIANSVSTIMLFLISLAGSIACSSPGDEVSDDAEASSEHNGISQEEFITICDKVVFDTGLEATAFSIPPELYTLPDIRNTPDEQVGGCDSYFFERNYNILYENYHGHEGCSMVIGEACAFGWLVHNDDPFDPEALEEHEHLCNGCSKESPCTHVFMSTLALGRQTTDFFDGGSTVCQLELIKYINLGPFEDRMYPVGLSVYKFIEEGGATKLAQYEPGVCTCSCKGVIDGCSTEGLDPKWITPYEPLPVETDPLTLVQPYEMTLESAYVGGWFMDDIWCSIGECLLDEGIFPDDVEAPASNK